MVLIRLHKKADLLDMKVNGMKYIYRKGSCVSFDLGNNGGHTPSSLDSRLIVVVSQASRQADDILAVYKLLKFTNFNSKARLGCLNGFIVPMASYQ